MEGIAPGGRTEAGSMRSADVLAFEEGINDFAFLRFSKVAYFEWVGGRLFLTLHTSLIDLLKEVDSVVIEAFLFD